MWLLETTVAVSCSQAVLGSYCVQLHVVSENHSGSVCVPKQSLGCTVLWKWGCLAFGPLLACDRAAVFIWTFN